VFAGARRGLWDFASAAAANRVLHARGEKGISLQLWHLGAKICELDAAMTPSLQSGVREAHPELVFLRLNGGAPLPSKHREEGDALRRRLLHREGFAEIARWLKHDRIGTGAKADDVLDACAMAIAARNFDKGFALPPNPAPRDRRGPAVISMLPRFAQLLEDRVSAFPGRDAACNHKRVYARLLRAMASQNRGRRAAKKWTPA